jgi:nitroimidazol reductase NimA-like FMN-containing flavoprotein (pyridoxamine 5'-phosphate oxidase superfamily)
MNPNTNMPSTAFAPQSAAYLDAIHIPLRLSCVTQSGWPYVLSLWYLHDAGKLYCATLESARVVSYLRREPRCGFEIAADQPPYCGVRGRAVAAIDPTQGQAVLSLLIDRYLDDRDNSLARRLLARSQDEVAIVLTPVQVFTWNYQRRMADAAPSRPDRICP